MIKFGIGQAVRRVEDRRFLTGQGRYVDDIALPGMCHGVNVLSPHAHARIRSIATTDAKAAHQEDRRVEGEGRAGSATGADWRRRRA